MSDVTMNDNIPMAHVCEVCGGARWGYIEVKKPIPGWHGPQRDWEAIFDTPVTQVVRAIVLCEAHYESALDGICDAEGASGGVSAWAPWTECDDPWHDGDEDAPHETYQIDMGSIIATGYGCLTCGFRTIT